MGSILGLGSKMGPEIGSAQIWAWALSRDQKSENLDWAQSWAQNRLKQGHLARPNFELGLKVGPKMLKFWPGLKVGTKNRLKQGHLARPNFELGLIVGPKRLKFWPGLKVGTKNRLKRGHLARPNFEPGLKVGPKRLSFEPDFGLNFSLFWAFLIKNFCLGNKILITVLHNSIFSPTFRYF